MMHVTGMNVVNSVQAVKHYESQLVRKFVLTKYIVNCSNLHKKLFVVHVQSLAYQGRNIDISQTEYFHCRKCPIFRILIMYL